jgi:uncharacterized protein
MTVQTLMVDLAEDECRELLAAAHVGRLGVVVDGRPEIYPVNHAYDPDSGTIAFPTKAGTVLDAALSWPWVAFEIDGQDADRGWSVLVVGRAETIEDPEEVARIANWRTVLWRASKSSRWLRVVPEKVTGRRISAAETG